MSQYNLSLPESPRTTSSLERSSNSNVVTFVVNNSTINQTENNNNTELHQQTSGTPLMILVFIYQVDLLLDTFRQISVI